MTAMVPAVAMQTIRANSGGYHLNWCFWKVESSDVATSRSMAAAVWHAITLPSRPQRAYSSQDSQPTQLTMNVSDAATV